MLDYTVKVRERLLRWLMRSFIELMVVDLLLCSICFQVLKLGWMT